MEPDGPGAVWESVVEIITMLQQRGDVERVAQWMKVLKRDNAGEAERLRVRLGLER